jgi:acetyl-CoA carboxylase biotin carboxyl carrier protein
MGRGLGRKLNKGLFVADENNVPTGPFDIATVRSLFELMDEFEVNEIDLRDGTKRIHLRRGQEIVTTIPTQGMIQPSIPMTSSTIGNQNPSTNNPGPAPNKYQEIKSPMVGTFYAKPAPEKDDYVKVGTRVSSDTVVCKIEAMKIFNDLVAGCSGTIVEILAQNGQFVEYDQVLFRVEPS